MTTDNLFLSSFGGVTQNSLMHNLHLTHGEEHNHQDIKHSSYYDSDQFLKDDKTGQNKHELLQYSVRTINNSKVSRITYSRKMHALYEKRV